MAEIFVDIDKLTYPVLARCNKDQSSHSLLQKMGFIKKLTELPFTIHNLKISNSFVQIFLLPGRCVEKRRAGAQA